MSASKVAASVSPALLVELRAVFLREVRARLPHLESGADPETAIRDAHTLASSAWVVGEPEIARLAREVELAYPGGPLEELLAALRSCCA